MLVHAENPQLIVYLSFDDLQNLCLLSKKHFTSYGIQRDLFVLLEAVFQGNEAKVAELLANKPALLMMKRAWTDCAGGTFESISAFQYTVLVHDADMVRTILDHVMLLSIIFMMKFRDQIHKIFLGQKAITFLTMTLSFFHIYSKSEPLDLSPFIILGVTSMVKAGIAHGLGRKNIVDWVMILA